MQRREKKHKEDYQEELAEVYLDVQEIEEKLAKTISIGRFMIQKQKEIFQECVETQEELEQLDIDRQTIEEQAIITEDELQGVRMELR